MHELEQRLLEAEQRAENAETQVTAGEDGRGCAGEVTIGLSCGHTHHTNELLSETRKTGSHVLELLLKLTRCMELSVGMKGSVQ